MKPGGTIRASRNEAGIALLISIFILLLISVVAIALIVSSGTESSLAGNYRSSAGVYYSALAGIEEARGRMSIKDPNSFKTTWASFYPAPGTTLPIGTIGYVLNPGPSDPTGPALLTTYQDQEYDSEFGLGALAGATIQTTPSVWNSNPLATNLAFPAPLYKWVRINAVSEKSLNLDVDADNMANSTTPLYYNNSTHRFSNNSTDGPQVFEITSLAVLPNANGQSSQKLLQYLVMATVLDLTFPAALTLDGPIGTFASSKNSDFYVGGIDQQHGGNCPPAPTESPKPAIGAVGSTSVTQVINGIPPYSLSPNMYRYANYISSSPQPTNPSVGDVSASGSGTLDPTFQTVSALDNAPGIPGLVQTISGLAEQHVTGPATGLPDYGSPGPPVRPVTTVVQGDLNLSGTLSGYGLLVVTGNLTLDGHVSWHGVILVIGQGQLNITSYGFGEIDGAVLIARTRYDDFTPRPSLGAVTFNVTNPNYGNGGFWYNSCWVNAVMPPASYKILSFHEIAQ